MRRHAALLLFVCVTASIALAQSAADTGRKQPSSTQSAQATELRIDWYRVNAEAVQRLAEYIRIDTSNPPGNEIRGVEWLKRAAETPFETGKSEPGRASIAAAILALLGMPPYV